MLTKQAMLKSMIKYRIILSLQAWGTSDKIIMTVLPNGGFHVVDYIVFSAAIIGSLAIGIYYACTGGKQKTTEEYFMGDRNLKVLPVTISMLASFVSGIGLMGTPAELYFYGTQYSLFIFAYMFGCIMGTYTFVPMFYNLKLTSVFEVCIQYVLQIIIQCNNNFYMSFITQLMYTCTLYSVLGNVNPRPWTYNFTGDPSIPLVIYYIGLFS